jgi:hypothetical protein
VFLSFPLTRGELGYGTQVQDLEYSVARKRKVYSPCKGLRGLFLSNIKKRPCDVHGRLVVVLTIIIPD